MLIAIDDYIMNYATGCSSEAECWFWEPEVEISKFSTPTHKIHFMKMYQEINELQSFTVEEFQADFDNLIDRVDSGESFLITSEHGNAVIVPYNEVVQIREDANMNLDEIVKIHTDHEEGS